MSVAGIGHVGYKLIGSGDISCKVDEQLRFLTSNHVGRLAGLTLSNPQFASYPFHIVGQYG